MGRLEFVSGVLVTMRKAGMVKGEDIVRVVEILAKECKGLSSIDTFAKLSERLQEQNSPLNRLEKLFKKEPVFIGWGNKKGVLCAFSDDSDVRYQWEGSEAEVEKYLKDYEDVNILLAYYSYEDYSGKAFVLFEEGGKLYEVNGGHCSCYGLEEQWSPSEVDLEELTHRLTEGTFGEDYHGDNLFKEELCELLEIECRFNSGREH